MATENWFTSMFSGDAKSGDAISGGALNITKITGLLVPIATAALAFVDELLGDDSPFKDMTLWQKVALVLALILFVAIIVFADVIGRAYATGKMVSAPIATFAHPLPVRHVLPASDVNGMAVAVRTGSDGTAEFLVSVDGSLSWIGGSDVDART